MTDFDITAYLPYLVNRAAARIANAFTAAIREHGVTLQMWRVLAALHHADGQRVSDVAALTSIDVTTLSRVLDGMERRGLAQRRRSRNGDARVVRIHVTPKGRTITGKIIPLARRYETVALAGFSPAERETLKTMLRRVYRNIEALEVEPDAAEAA
jgi:DNA-binding MarR family transcriptional regulator